jgi:hypothetical protein
METLCRFCGHERDEHHGYWSQACHVAGCDCVGFALHHELPTLKLVKTEPEAE